MERGPGVPQRTARLRHSFAIIQGAASLFALQLAAQAATGKLEGRVDNQAGVPLGDVQVHLVGSAFGAETDSHGYYFINNVPAGTYKVRAALIGFQPLQVTGLRILSDQTTTQHFTLTAALLQLGQITVIAAGTPLVPRDEVTTKQRIDGQFADALPVDRLNDIVTLQPGVVEVVGDVLSGGRVATERGLSIRGSRETQNVTYVDGVPVQPGYKGDRFDGRGELGPPGTGLEIATNGIEEASVTTGAPSAAFGNANAGIISIVTRTGGGEYHGALSYETDEVFGVDHGPGINRLEGAFSGPLAGRLSFAVSGTLEGRQSVEEGFGSQQVPIFLPAGVDTILLQLSALDDTLTPNDERLTADTTLVPVYDYAVSRGRCESFATAGSAGLELADSAYVRRIRNNFGFTCNGVRLPATARTRYTTIGKLNYTYGAGSRLTLSVAASRYHGQRYDFIIRYLNRLALSALRGFSNRSRVATLNWAPNLSKSVERALALDVSLSYQEDRTIGGPLTGESAQATRSPFGGFILRPMRFLFGFDNFPIDEHLIRNIRLGDKDRFRTYPIRSDDPTLNGVDNLRNDAYGLYGTFQGFRGSMGGDTWRFRESGGPLGTINLYAERRYVGKVTLDWQAARYSRLILGSEVTRYTIASFSSPLNHPGEAYLGRPIRWNAFVEDRLDFGDVVLVGGLRYDGYDSRVSRPYVTDSLGNRFQLPRISTVSGFDSAHPTAMFVRDRAHGYLSPRVQVSFPVTDQTNFRLSYAHQVQAPDLGLLLSGTNMDLDFNNVGQVVGTDLDFGKTIAYEVGIRHAFSDDMVLDVAAYNKNIISDPAARVVTRFDSVKRRDVKINMMTNLDFGSVRGLDVRLDRRFGQFFNGTVAYAYQFARNTGSDPFTYIYYGSLITDPTTGRTQPPPQGILPTDNSRPHALTAAFSITVPGDWKPGSLLGQILRNVSVFSTLRYTSGTAYSRCGTGPEDQSVLSSENCHRQFLEGINTQRLPPFKELNARLVKAFALGRLDVSGYLDVRNLLNFKNILEVFATNGSLRNDVERAENLKADLADLARERVNNVALGAVGPDSSLVLPFLHQNCATWLSSNFLPAAANCMYLIRAEQRFGDGDGVFTIEEQSRAINALYDVARGEHAHTAPGRRARVGFEIAF
jgi:Carboxypeptidase regulatory-like domain/TonB-dependent Receptor Plug Domain